MLLNIFIIIFYLTGYCMCDIQQSNLNNYTIFEITAFNTRERAVLYHEQTTNDAVIFLNGVTNIVSSPMYVIVSNCCTEEFLTTLEENGIDYILVRKSSVIDEFKKVTNISGKMASKNREPSVGTEFLDWNKINLWVKYQEKKYPTLKRLYLGNTYESRELFVLKISSKGHVKKPAVFIMGGEQGRDKMSTALILNFIEKVLSSKHYLKLTNAYDLYFMPVFNPDGYEYSLKTAWFWNKNKKLFFPEKICHKSHFQNDKALGVNIDRNWFITNSVFVEGDECDSVFLGNEALTEEEPRLLAQFLNARAEKLMAFITIRGYGSLLTVPYAEQQEFANNYAVLSEMLLHASNAAFIEYNVSCNLCSTHNCFYNFTGNAPDWVKKNMNVPVVFTLYLKHEDSFLPQVDHIPTLLLHLGIIIKETLLLAYDIYGPLFKCAAHLSICFTIVVLPFMYSLKNTLW